jgi:hypothetical protein
MPALPLEVPALALEVRALAQEVPPRPQGEVRPLPREVQEAAVEGRGLVAAVRRDRPIR